MLAWLVNLLAPKPNLSFEEATIDGQRVLVLRIPAPMGTPLAFKRVRYVRVDKTNRTLADYPEKEAEIWRLLRGRHVEDEVCKEGVTEQEVRDLVDVDAYFRLCRLGTPAPGTDLQMLLDRGFLRHAADGTFSVTLLGGLLLAKRISDFGSLERKAVRVVRYDGDDRSSPTKPEVVGRFGYAVGFAKLLTFMQEQLGQERVESGGSRRTVMPYPDVAIRELLANALIHQDLTISGAGPLIHIFRNRLEVSNPGEPLIPTDRFLDNPPRSRNERLANAMRQLGICEERGNGIDRVVAILEASQLPAPHFRVADAATQVTLFVAKPISELTQEQRVRACYWHACLRYVGGHPMTNESLRTRLSLRDDQAAMASGIIKDTVAADLVRVFDPKSKSRRHAKYVPYWAE